MIASELLKTFGSQLDSPISGWLETERINQYDRDINVGLIMNPRNSWVPLSKCARPEVTVVSVEKNRQPHPTQITPDGYLINTYDNSTFWWHITDDPDVRFEGGKEHQYTWFTPIKDTFWDTGDM